MPNTLKVKTFEEENFGYTEAEIDALLEEGLDSLERGDVFTSQQVREFLRNKSQEMQKKRLSHVH